MHLTPPDSPNEPYCRKKSRFSIASPEVSISRETKEEPKLIDPLADQNANALKNRIRRSSQASEVAMEMNSQDIVEVPSNEDRADFSQLSPISTVSEVQVDCNPSVNNMPKMLSLLEQLKAANLIPNDDDPQMGKENTNSQLSLNVTITNGTLTLFHQSEPVTLEWYTMRRLHLPNLMTKLKNSYIHGSSLDLYTGFNSRKRRKEHRRNYVQTQKEQSIHKSARAKTESLGGHYKIMVRYFQENWNELKSAYEQEDIGMNLHNLGSTRMSDYGRNNIEQILLKRSELCPKCGLKHNDAMNLKKTTQNHIDSHVRKELGTLPSKAFNWYTDASTWLVQEVEDVPTPTVVDVETGGCVETKYCPVCAECFQTKYNSKEDVWRYKNSMKIDHILIHQCCLGDYLNSSNLEKTLRKKREPEPNQSDKYDSDIEIIN